MYLKRINVVSIVVKIYDDLIYINNHNMMLKLNVPVDDVQ
ncbi:unnamed protein product [Schistosoma mattheei]|uniref:Uncharacterized protein n=1 Tax=Schistosoma mattheei TaxID=31246 RepID=A0A3P8J9L3_9TREM|nr:unnamed protein product [Schistosoma mattheei]